MQVTVIGAGGAFADMKRGNSSFLIDYGDRRILVDCGPTVPYILRDEMGIPLESITDLIITHTHGDHIGGAEMLLEVRRWIGGKKTRVHAAPWVRRMVDSAFRPMDYVVGQHSGTWVDHYEAGSFWNTEALWDSDTMFVFEIGDLKCGFVKTQHIEDMPSSAVIIGPLSISGDTNRPVDNLRFWEGAKLVFHEAEYSDYVSGAHCQIGNLVKHVRENWRSKRVWTYHCPEDVPGVPPITGVLRKGDTFHIGDTDLAMHRGRS